MEKILNRNKEMNWSVRITELMAAYIKCYKLLNILLHIDFKL
jgi:hypothetical protein